MTYKAIFFFIEWISKGYHGKDIIYKNLERLIENFFILESFMTSKTLLRQLWRQATIFFIEIRFSNGYDGKDVIYKNLERLIEHFLF